MNFLIKPASSLCNLRCKYCFYDDIGDNRSVKDMGLMRPETVDLLLSEGYRLAGKNGAVHFAFQGGEPTLAGLPFFEAFVQKARAACPDCVRTSYAIQTNGMLIDRAWARFFKDNHFLVGISLDGCKDIHNLWRTDAAGAATWARACGALQLLDRHQVDVNVLCVVTGQIARHAAKVYGTLKKLGVRYMQFIPCMDPIGQARGAQKYSLTPKLYGDCLCALFDLWYGDWKNGQYHSIRLFDEYVNLMLGDPAVTCSTCGNCGAYFVVEGDGSVYPCDFFALDKWKLGRLGEDSLAEMAAGDTAREFLGWGTGKPLQCGNCRWRSLCNGGCKNDWVVQDGMETNYFCASFQKFFAYAEQRLMEIARAEHMARRRGQGELWPVF